MRRLMTVTRSEKCVVRRFRRCANVIECTYTNLNSTFLISNFRRALNDVCFLLGNSPAFEFYMPTIRNTYIACLVYCKNHK